MMFLKFAKFHRKAPVLESLDKNRLQNRCVPVKIRKFLSTPILKNICERLLVPFLGFRDPNHRSSSDFRGDIASCIITINC